MTVAGNELSADYLVDVLVLPAHASRPIAFDRRAVAARLDDVVTWLSGWLVSESAFVERVRSKLPPTPPNFVRIVDLNEAGEFPTGDPTDLEAGARRQHRRALEQARRRAVAPFVIMHDRTLAAIATSLPRSIAQLDAVPGIGPAKLAAYGDAILSVVTSAITTVKT